MLPASVPLPLVPLRRVVSVVVVVVVVLSVAALPLVLLLLDGVLPELIDEPLLGVVVVVVDVLELVPDPVVPLELGLVVVLGLIVLGLVVVLGLIVLGLVVVLGLVELGLALLGLVVLDVPLPMVPLELVPLELSVAPDVPGDDAAPVLALPCSMVGEPWLEPEVLPDEGDWAETKVAAAARDTAAATARRLGSFFIEDSL